MQVSVKCWYDDIWDFGRLVIVSTDHHEPKFNDERNRFAVALFVERS